MNKKNKIVAIIPSRYGATRFPGKSLAPILNKPMILWVLDGASKSERLDDLIVATDSDLIIQTVENAGYKAVMTRDDHPSGTDRIWEVAEKLDCTHVLNVQGDEPLITGKIIDDLISVIDEEPNLEMATLVTSFKSFSEAQNPNRVKVVVDEDNRAMYFSRSLIPYPLGYNQSSDYRYLLHIGLYLYRRDFLKSFIEHGPSPLEKIERLEQLRALSMGATIKTVFTESPLMSIDSPEDVPSVENFLRGPMPA